MRQSISQFETRPWIRNRHVKRLFEIYDNAGAELRIVGGAVRNALLNRPVLEIDMAINKSPEDMLNIAQEAGLNCIPTGISHGTATFIMGEDPVRKIEVTSLRTDVSSDGRYAQVAFTDKWEEDARRRDFTMNALYCTREGRVVDPLGVIEDVLNEKIVFIAHAEERVKEDYLRILRFFRFSAEYGLGTLDAKGLAACEKLKSGLETLSRERIGHEFLKLVVARHCLAVLLRMEEIGVYKMVMPGGLDLSYLRNVLEFENMFGFAPSPMRRLAALLLPAVQRGSVDALEVQKRLALSSRQRHYLEHVWSLASEVPSHLDLENMRQYLYKWGDDFAFDMLSLAYACDPNKEKFAWQKKLFIELGFIRPVFPVTGDELIAKGVAPGPDLGLRLKTLEEKWIETDFSLSREELLAEVS